MIADLGFRIAATTQQAALECLGACLHDGGSHVFCFCEANLLSHALRSAELRAALARADAVFPDGVSLVLLARLRGARLPGRVSGPAFMAAACDYGQDKGWRHFLLGGEPGVVDRLASCLRREYPRLQIVGTHSPPFRELTEAEEDELKERIEGAEAHLLWVGLGGPRQEMWMAEHVGKIDVPVMLGLGAAFDFHSGNRRWAPRWIRQIGLEWAYRTVTGGRKTFVRNVKCVSIVGVYLAKVALKRALGGKAQRVSG